MVEYIEDYTSVDSQVVKTVLDGLSDVLLDCFYTSVDRDTDVEVRICKGVKAQYKYRDEKLFRHPVTGNTETCESGIKIKIKSTEYFNDVVNERRSML